MTTKRKTPLDPIWNPPTTEDADFYFDLDLEIIEDELSKKKANHIDLADQLVATVGRYLDSHAIAKDDEKQYRNAQKFIELSEKIFTKALGKRVKKRKNGQDIAILIQALMHMGASRIKTLESIAKFVGRDQGTVRKYHEAFRQQKAMYCEKTEKAKSRFLNVYSHDLVNFLSPIKAEFPTKNAGPLKAFKKLKKELDERRKDNKIFAPRDSFSPYVRVRK